MPGGFGDIDALTTLVSTGERLSSMGFAPDTVRGLLDLSSAAALKERAGSGRPLFAGLLGCTGTGKSTLFNSLVGRDLSTVGWKTHNTRGPVIFCPEPALETWTALEHEKSLRLFPAWERKILDGQAPETAPETGAPGRLTIARGGTDPGSPRLVLFDLPDINSTLSASDGLVALDVLPWLDAVIFVTDDETLFHRAFDAPVRLAAELGLARFLVLANRGGDRADPENADIQQALSYFGADRLFLLPDLSESGRYPDAPDFPAFRDALLAACPGEPRSMHKIGDLAADILAENETRRTAAEELYQSVSDAVGSAGMDDAAVSIEALLNKDVLALLEHLGLRRLSATNLLYFLKKAATTGSLRKGFKQAFGNRTEDGVSGLFRFDADKFAEHVTRQIVDFAETLSSRARRAPAAARIPAFSKVASGIADHAVRMVGEPRFRADVEALLAGFEKDCRDLLATDSVSAAVKNDPLMAAVVFTAVLADAYLLPGFGSWLIVPTAYKYLPVGKFADIKKRFRKNLSAFIRQRLFELTLHAREQTERLVLAPGRPGHAALTALAGRGKRR